ncbi:MAG: tRNA (adenosine(37)-N6)-dimethylallyltransferase MiaA [Bacteroidaceae bacterium]|nr:tRNA (adenosine(37)-N6)-dimethylallyltransferase MiaA [Bacteroidaceae bacterium]
MNNTLVVLLGPTAVGKTELSIRLAKLLSCDIISADSRQIYQDIDIGTAKPTKEEQEAVKHHFIDILPLTEYYSAAQYESDVLNLLEQQFQKNSLALMVGGSMMYIDAVTKGIDDIPTIDDETREMMRQKFETEGLDALSAELKLLDPEYYELVDKKNHKRIVHALEICYQTGHTYTSFRKNQTKERPFRIVKVGLRRERENLFSRINARVDQMMKQGLMDEVRKVYPLRELNALNTVGYKELFKVLDGEWELRMAVERMKKNTRVYAKKQMTWFAHDEEIHWIDVDKLPIEQQILQIRELLESKAE